MAVAMKGATRVRECVLFLLVQVTQRHVLSDHPGDGSDE
jgi:hypothetical protein